MRNEALAAAMTLALIAAPRAVLAADQLRAGSPLQAGDRIRLWAPTIPKQSVGQVVEAGPEILKIRFADRPDPVDVPLVSVTRLQRSLGQRAQSGKGALRGGLVGATLGLAVLLQAIESCDGGCEAGGSAPAYLAIYAGIPAAAGAIVGALVGGRHKTDRWENLPTGRAGLRFVPHRRGGGLALSVRF